MGNVTVPHFGVHLDGTPKLKKRLFEKKLNLSTHHI